MWRKNTEKQAPSEEELKNEEENIPKPKTECRINVALMVEPEKIRDLQAELEELFNKYQGL